MPSHCVYHIRCVHLTLVWRNYISLCLLPCRPRLYSDRMSIMLVINFWANDSTGYTLVEPRHIRVPFVYRHYTHAADWPAPHFTPICRGSASVYPAASFFVPNCTLLLRTCTLIRREIAGNKTLPPDHGITRHNKPQRPPDHGHNTA